MRRPACISLLLCFLISTVCFPEADFSLLAQLPALYRHCKAIEDPDMDSIDLITNHLINIDGIFDKRLPGDNQKSHWAFQFHNLQHANTFICASLQMKITEPVFQLNNFKLVRSKSFRSDYIGYIFHPPDPHEDYQAA
jgi:hypothetical protein